MVVLTTRGEVAIVTVAGFPSTTAGIATAAGVVVVVVVTTGLLGTVGGGAEITCDTGSEAQPAKRTRAPQHARTGVSCLAAQTEAERDRNIIFVFILRRYSRIRSITTGVFYVVMNVPV